MTAAPEWRRGAGAGRPAARSIAVRRAAIEAAILAARRRGATLREAAAAGGVHVATVCRWQAADPDLGAALRAAEAAARRAARTRRGPRVVPIHPACPQCGGPYVVRSRWHYGHPVMFWRCADWPACPWASWRPRFPADCPACRGPRYWSKSRLSVSCTACGTRWPA